MLWWFPTLFRTPICRNCLPLHYFSPWNFDNFLMLNLSGNACFDEQNEFDDVYSEGRSAPTRIKKIISSFQSHASRGCSINLACRRLNHARGLFGSCRNYHSVQHFIWWMSFSFQRRESVPQILFVSISFCTFVTGWNNELSSRLPSEMAWRITKSLANWLNITGKISNLALRYAIGKDGSSWHVKRWTMQESRANTLILCVAYEFGILLRQNGPLVRSVADTTCDSLSIMINVLACVLKL
jgi:hypothetical protein